MTKEIQSQTISTTTVGFKKIYFVFFNAEELSNLIDQEKLGGKTEEPDYSQICSFLRK